MTEAIAQRIPPPRHNPLGPFCLQIIERIYRPSPIPDKPSVLDEVREGRWECF